MLADPVRYLIQQSGGKGLLHAVQSVPAWHTRHREVPPQNNTECLDVCVQIVNDLPRVSKLINDLKKNHVFYSFSRAAILVSQIISNFPSTGNYSFFIHLFKSEHKNGSLPIFNAFSAEVHMVSENKQQFLVNFYYIAM